jgi:hypothetical protein
MAARQQKELQLLLRCVKFGFVSKVILANVPELQAIFIGLHALQEALLAQVVPGRPGTMRPGWHGVSSNSSFDCSCCCMLLSMVAALVCLDHNRRNMQVVRNSRFSCFSVAF